MDAVTTQDQMALRARLSEAHEQLDILDRDLRGVDDELSQLSTERRQHKVLLEACDRLEELSSLGGAELFWGDRIDQDALKGYFSRARGRVDIFERRIREIESRRQAIVSRINEQQGVASVFEDELFEAQEEEERRKQEWIIEREISKLPARSSTLPWFHGGEDDKRFRKALSIAIAICLFIAILAPLIHLPLQIADQETKMPERVVQLLESRPKPPPPREERKPPPSEHVIKQKPPETKQPVKQQKQAPEQREEQPEEEQGLLAFRDKLANIKEDQVVAKLGSQAQIDKAADSAKSTQRAMLTTNAPGSSGGINVATLSRNVGSGGGNGMARVQVARATSALTGIGTPGGSRPLSNGAGPSRTDEEIQIVFDRYKAALYRLYNRELRKDPTLRGQIVLRLTIEPDGSVSMCQQQTSDMNAPELSAQVVDRVKTINFGAKDGVPAITIVYPIDFLPAA